MYARRGVYDVCEAFTFHTSDVVINETFSGYVLEVFIFILQVGIFSGQNRDKSEWNMLVCGK